MAKPRAPRVKPRLRPKARGPAMKSELKSRAKASSSRGSLRPKPSRVLALLEAIRAAPFDDDLALVFADALEETGELSRAELVRTQIARMCGKADAATNARALLLQADRDKVIGARTSRWESLRGLVWYVSARTDEWLAHGRALFEEEPITAITVRDPREDRDDDDDLVEDQVERLSHQPWLEHVHALEIPQYTSLSEGDVVALLGSPHLKRMTQLTVGHPTIAITAANHCAMPQLCALVVQCDGSAASDGDDVIRAFAGRSLTRLELVGCGTSAEGIRAIADAGWPLERLLTAGTHYTADDIGEAGMRAIAQTPSLASLRELSIESGGLDDAALRVLAGAPHLRKLETLSLFGNEGVTDDGIVMLAESAVLVTVRTLNLIGTRVTEKGRATLPDHVVAI